MDLIRHNASFHSISWSAENVKKRGLIEAKCLFSFSSSPFSYTHHDKFVIQQKDSDEELVINRINRNVSIQGKSPKMPFFVSQMHKHWQFRICTDNKNQYHDSRTLRKVCGVLGTVKLIHGHYLVVATHREFVGVINGHVIWRLAGHDLIPYIPSTIHLSELQVSGANSSIWQLISPLAHFFAESTERHLHRYDKSRVGYAIFLLFVYVRFVAHVATIACDASCISWGIDWANSRLCESISIDFVCCFQMGMAERADQRFVWNRHLLSELQSSSALKNYCLPIIHGCKWTSHFPNTFAYN